jgi:CRP-like cAMP-binding protein
VAGSFLIRGGEPLSGVYLLCSGWAQRFLLLPNGDQVIVQLHLAGDLVGVGSALLGTAAHYNVAALTPVTVRVLDPERVSSIFSTSPELGRKLAATLARRERVVDFRLLNLGRRRTDERVAALILYIYARQQRLGLAHDHSFLLPLSQEQIGDIVGAHAIHINRVLRSLREAGLVTVQNREVRIGDLDRLRRFGCFCESPVRLADEPELSVPSVATSGQGHRPE